MSDEVKNFIDQIADGDNAAAGEAFKDALRMKVGDSLDNHRKDVANSIFNTTGEAEAHSSPKPDIADAGTFNPDGSVSTSADGEAELDLSQDAIVGVDVDTNQ